MRRPQSVTVAGLAVILAVSVGCGSGNENETTSASKTRVPDRLNSIEGATEDIIDIVPESRWADITKDVRKIDNAWSGYKEQAVRDGAAASLVARFSDSLAGLRVAADAEKGPETSQAANDVSAATVELFGLYKTARPTDIARLDVLGRQIILDVERGDLGAAGAQVKNVASIWQGGLREDVLAHQGRAVADQTDAVLTAIDRAVVSADRDALVNQTKAFLEVVDAMERLY
jgi:hypothetical protein